MTPSEILRLTKVENKSAVYALSRIDGRLTVKSQQTRSLNLAYALSECYPSGVHVGVIGGGIGGLTLAEGLLRRGAQVTIFESKPAPLHRMAAASHRILHPGISDWPDPAALDP